MVPKYAFSKLQVTVLSTSVTWEYVPKWVPRSLIRCQVLLDNGSRHTLLTRYERFTGQISAVVRCMRRTVPTNCDALSRHGEPERASPWLHSPSFASNLKQVTNVYTLFDVALFHPASKYTLVQLLSTTDVATAHANILSAQLHQPGKGHFWGHETIIVGYNVGGAALLMIVAFIFLDPVAWGPEYVSSYWTSDIDCFADISFLFEVPSYFALRVLGVL